MADVTSQRTRASTSPAWMKLVLLASCVHSGVWGVFIMAAPAMSAKVYGFSQVPHDVHLWQATGLFITLLAIGYGLAASNPIQHWGIVLIAFLAKVLGAIGMCSAVYREQVSPNVLWLLPFDDVIWWVPFAMIIRHGIQGSPKNLCTAV